MAKHLQLSIDAAGFHVTPLDLPISNAVASSLTEAFMAADLAEGQVIHAVPEIDGSFAVKTPINFAFIHTSINVAGTYELRIVDKDPVPALTVLVTPTAVTPSAPVAEANIAA